MEHIMEWPRLTAIVIATVFVFGVIAIIAAIVHMLDRRFIMAARNASAAGGSGGGGTEGDARSGGGEKQTTEEGKPMKEGIVKNIWKNWLAFPAVMMVVISIITLILRFSVFPEPLVIFGTPIRLWLLAFFGLTAWLFSRKEDIAPDQWGVKTCFGCIVQDFGEGPALVPPGAFQLQRFPALQFSVQIGARETKPTLQLLRGIIQPEEIQRCHESLNDVLEVNFAPPEHAKWTENSDEDANLESAEDATRRGMEAIIEKRKKEYERDPAHTRLTAKMKVTIRVRIDRDGVRDFVHNIGSVDRAILELNELARTVVARWCGKRTAPFVSRHLDLLGLEILSSVEDLVGDKKPTVPRDLDRKVLQEPWGVDILQTEVHALDLPPFVMDAVATVMKSTADAAGERIVLTERGKGAAEARREMGIADAAAVEAMNANLTTDAGKFARAMEAAEKMVQAGNVVFSGDNPVAVAAAQIKAAFDAYQPPKAQPPRPTAQNQPPKGGTP